MRPPYLLRFPAPRVADRIRSGPSGITTRRAAAETTATMASSGETRTLIRLRVKEVPMQLLVRPEGAEPPTPGAKDRRSTIDLEARSTHSWSRTTSYRRIRAAP